MYIIPTCIIYIYIFIYSFIYIHMGRLAEDCPLGDLEQLLQSRGGCLDQGAPTPGRPSIVHIYIYIYMYRERERAVYMYICIHVNQYISLYIYIYI